MTARTLDDTTPPRLIVMRRGGTVFRCAAPHKEEPAATMHANPGTEDPATWDRGARRGSEPNAAVSPARPPMQATPYLQMLHRTRYSEDGTRRGTVATTGRKATPTTPYNRSHATCAAHHVALGNRSWNVTLSIGPVTVLESRSMTVHPASPLCSHRA